MVDRRVAGSSLGRLHGSGSRPFSASTFLGIDLVLDILSFLEIVEAGVVHARVVEEDVGSRVSRDESKTTIRNDLLNYALRHYCHPHVKRQAYARGNRSPDPSTLTGRTPGRRLTILAANKAAFTHSSPAMSRQLGCTVDHACLPGQYNTLSALYVYHMSLWVSIPPARFIVPFLFRRLGATRPSCRDIRGFRPNGGDGYAQRHG